MDLPLSCSISNIGIPGFVYVGAIFSSVNYFTTPRAGLRQTVVAWRRSWHCSTWTVSPTPLWCATECSGCIGEGTTIFHFTRVPTSLGGCADPICACATRYPVSNLPPTVFVLLSMLSGAMSQRLTPYSVVKIFSDIVTKHCCQVYLLSMMFCRSNWRMCPEMVSW